MRGLPVNGQNTFILGVSLSRRLGESQAIATQQLRSTKQEGLVVSYGDLNAYDTAIEQGLTQQQSQEVSEAVFVELS